MVYCRKTLPLLLLAILAQSPAFAGKVNTTEPNIIPPKFVPKYSLAYVMGNTANVTAKVNDDLGVASVYFYYRVRGATTYNSIKLKQTAADMFETQLQDASIREPGLEYYFQATDISGNTAALGNRNQPFILAFKAAAQTSPTGHTKSLAKALASKPESSPTSKWVWIAIGSIVAGGAAVAISNSHNDSGQSARTEDGVVITRGPLP